MTNDELMVSDCLIVTYRLMVGNCLTVTDQLTIKIQQCTIINILLC
jgi:hypothetical protein